MPWRPQAQGIVPIGIVGIDVHIGSQITDVEPFVAALEKMLEFVDVLRTEGVPLDHLDLGGGLGIRYRDEKPPALKDYLGRLFGCLGGRKLRVLFRSESSGSTFTSVRKSRMSSRLSRRSRRCSSSSMSCGRRASPSTTWIWAEGSAFATGMKSRPH